MSKKTVDEVTGVETTGHEWDGLQELNKPLPKWWLYTFYVSIVWAIGYMIVYPAWPTLNDYTKGIWGYSQRATVAAEVKAGKDAQAALRAQIDKTPLAQIKSNPDLLRFAQAGGRAAFAENCAPCHGRGAAGAKGYPNLNDDEWIWGGKIEQIHETILYGVRSAEKKTRDSAMPKFGIEKLLDEKQINDATEYVLSLTGKAGDKAAADRGAKLYTEQCASCHGDKGQGNQELGAPSLTDAIWLYGSDRKDVFESIWTGRGGMMPAWTGRLDPVTVKALAVYVHTLGGGK